jgi:hypothetical protein
MKAVVFFSSAMEAEKETCTIAFLDYGEFESKRVFDGSMLQGSLARHGVDSRLLHRSLQLFPPGG